VAMLGRGVGQGVFSGVCLVKKERLVKVFLAEEGGLN
jgi:hypothetical protein